MRLTVWLGTSAVFLFLPSVILADEQTRPWKPTKDGANIPYSGTVTEVTKDSITVQWPREKPKKFDVSETLATGGIPKEPRLMPGQRQPYTVWEPYRYRLEDVKAGDQVVIIYAHIGDADICDHICINKRPGGRVPPLPEGAVHPKKLPPNLPKGFVIYGEIPYHERMNAYWDLEDHGIPYPAKFGPYRRFPVAPMPREVKVGPPSTP